MLAGRLPRSTLDANHLRKILESNDREAIWAVEKAWGTIRAERDPEREKVVAAMGDVPRRHLGDPRAGRAVFRKLCAQCHTIYGEGQSVGPDLTSSGRGSFDQLLASVFDPSLVIGAAYQTTTVVTEGGRSLTGLVVEDSDRRVVLKLPGGGQEVVPRHDVKAVRIGRLSMMPEGIEKLLGKQELADLFAFLALDRPPDDPRARPIPGAPAARSAEGGAPRFPRTPPSEPGAAAATFRTRHGFHMELIACEPLVYDPVAAAYDEDGRLYVVEMSDYPHVDPKNDRPFAENTQDPPVGRLKLLTDRDGDGRFDTATVLTDNLSWPTGVAPWKGGAFVAATPSIWYIKDADGDGRAEIREEVFRGFRKYNIQAVMNNLQWGLDHAIYGAGFDQRGRHPARMTRRTIPSRS